MKILFIEDEEDIAYPIISLLKEQNYEVDYKTDGQEGLQNALVNEYSCIVLDLNLPNIDGLNILQKIRSEDIDTPILILSARAQLVNKLEGFNLGVDDYVTKPFNMEELLARIDALIRRSSLNKSIKLKFGENILIPNKNMVQSSSGPVYLSNKETALLEYLIRNKFEIVSAEELLEHVWNSEIDTFTDTVRTTIKTLRQKIDAKKKYIKTFRGKGYMLVDTKNEKN